VPRHAAVKPQSVRLRRRSQRQTRRSKVAEAQQRGAVSSSEAAQATIARIKADLDECALKAPRTGWAQYRVTQVGEVLGVGGKVLNLVELADVYLTFVNKNVQSAETV
jgi:HlyD family secretion protein